jgi:pyruvate dehydrogenase kinase 2/3/4
MKSIINIIKHNIKKPSNSLKIIKSYHQPITNKYLVTQSNFLKNELEIRLSHRIKDLINLPYGLPLTSEISSLTDSYITSLGEIYKHPNIDTSNDINKFTNLLLTIRDRHANAEFQVSNGIQKIKYFDLIDNKTLNKHLDNFFIERIGVRTLISQQITSVNYKQNIVKKCNLKNIIQDSVDDINMSCDRIYNDTANINITINPELNMLYIPSHIYYIVNEITKNSVIAHFDNSLEENPINISAYEGNDDIIIKISDSGLGFPRKKINKLMSYYYSSNPIEITAELEAANMPILGGLGVGLPLAKVYSKYLGGDIRINPIEGFGTEVLIYLDKTENAIENIN